MFTPVKTGPRGAVVSFFVTLHDTVLYTMYTCVCVCVISKAACVLMRLQCALEEESIVH